MSKKTAKARPKPKVIRLRTPDARVSALGIARATAKDIERGVYQPGSRIREQELADKFKCSRAPVREALRILESQGIVVIEPMRGARVATVDDATFYEVFLIRRALAGLIIQQVVKASPSPARDEFVSRAQSLTDAAETCPDGHTFAGSVRRTIQIMQKVAQTPRTLHLIRSLTFGYLAFQDDIVATKKSRRAQAKLWMRIADAVENGEAEEARAAMDELFDFAFEYVAEMKSAKVANLAD